MKDAASRETDDPSSTDEGRRTIQRFAERVRLVREMRGLSPTELASRSDLGVDFVLQIERAECDVNLSAVYKIAEALSCAARDLVRAHGDDAMVVVDTPLSRPPR